MILFVMNKFKEAYSSNSASNLNDLVYSKGHVYIPDFTVRAMSDIEFVKVKRHQYIAAKRATLMERQPKTPREQADAAVTEDPFSAEWKKANQFTQNHQEEGTVLPPYLRQHQRNYSSGNLEELRKRESKLSPLIRNSSNVNSGPERTIIYPENRDPKKRGSTTFPEKAHLIVPPGLHADDSDEIS